MVRIASLSVLFCLAFAPGSLTITEIDQRVEKWQPTAKERAFERIGWAKDIRDALRLAKANNRAVFLFTHDGHLGVGRC